ncbi:MAG: 50S ribosomal protein L31 [Patescibacteria group bacterium]|nr:50S ribosomal protein L31 [Patescibacteria group bacterium]
MKTDIHPQYHSKSIVTCACGKTFTTGSTVESISIELCSACHPFYTGQQKIVDTARRVEKFQARQEKKEDEKVLDHKAKQVKKAARAKARADKKIKATEA